MSEENTQTTEQNVSENEKNQPDFIVKQYRIVRIEDGLKKRKEQIGAAWNGAKGEICVRLSGKQVVEGDIYLFPSQDEPA